jgi:uncharacterized protein
MNQLTLDQKLAAMQSILRDLESVAVAFSAGVDSTLVLKVALDVLGPANVVAVTGRSDSLARDEFDQAVELASAVGAEHVVLDTDEFQNPNYTSNPNNRCYFCKTTLYDHMTRFIRDRGLNTIVNGINVDDLGDYRPGIQAAKEHDVRCPAADAGLTKADVRELSWQLGLPTFDKPASPCLSSRVPYGQAVTTEKLRMIEAAEKFIHSLGIRECRVRHYEGGTGANAETLKRRNAEILDGAADPNDAWGHIARVEVPIEVLPYVSSPEMSARIRTHFHSLGYSEVTFDPRGFRTGSLNEAILVNIASKG